ncbi:PhzF family phenazine biosynthesis protein [Aurantimonas sp. Leaf443]|uniref:PhzF family phenazine biosynthesis protein n=1 Tax=Aurantimonas sp. Leaf443 TaxID=1736378 RepID=UPI0006FAFEA2|nr:PhzF family phenazine biosynthesis protein [Aurantimonas sp. Leaf443]KQT86058.1 isomerase [Aurantimonas sp. Leaf443]
MPTLPIFQVDAFADRLFAGNPAAVVPLAGFLPDEVLQAIATENNLSETAFLVPAGPARWRLRWFTPAIEVPLCGHATLASAHVLFEEMGEPGPVFTFETLSGDLAVARRDGRLEMRLPRRDVSKPGPVERLTTVLNARPVEAHVIPAAADDTWLALFETEAQVRALQPDFRAMAKLPCRNVMATAPGDGCDFVSRYFAPKGGIDEDPVTGSAHCGLVPFWAARTGRDAFHARQVSRRGGDLFCRLEPESVIVAGRAQTYLKGEIRLPG